MAGADSDPSERPWRHAVISASLMGRNDDELLDLELSQGPRSVWSRNGVAQVEGHSVFVKRVPLTATECEHPYSTRNHFNLPAFYQYGVGSAGFGAFRELAALQTVTDWVLSGETSAFPLLFHHRVMPGHPGPWKGRMGLEDYIRFWADDDAVACMMRERVSADRELWLFLEYFPRTVSDWFMPTNQSEVDWVISQLSDAIGVLRRHGFVHFDAHLANMVLDGHSLYLADFGLAVGTEFELAPLERNFFAKHRHYDLGLALFSIGLMLSMHIQKQPAEVRADIDRACGITKDSDHVPVITRHVGRCRQVAEIVELAPEYVSALERFSSVISYMSEFLDRLQGNPQKHAEYRNAELLARLRAAGLPHLEEPDS
jgi:serine/threonine protein kinase